MTLLNTFLTGLKTDLIGLKNLISFFSGCSRRRVLPFFTLLLIQLSQEDIFAKFLQLWRSYLWGSLSKKKVYWFRLQVKIIKFSKKLKKVQKKLLLPVSIDRLKLRLWRKKSKKPDCENIMSKTCFREPINYSYRSVTVSSCDGNCKMALFWKALIW